jgi:hypothetical protein
LRVGGSHFLKSFLKVEDRRRDSKDWGRFEKRPTRDPPTRKSRNFLGIMKGFAARDISIWREDPSLLDAIKQVAADLVSYPWWDRESDAYHSPRPWGVRSIKFHTGASKSMPRSLMSGTIRGCAV